MRYLIEIDRMKRISGYLSIFNLMKHLILYCIFTSNYVLCHIDVFFFQLKSHFIIYENFLLTYNFNFFGFFHKQDESIVHAMITLMCTVHSYIHNK